MKYLIFFLLMPCLLQAQFAGRVVVTDSGTGSPLAFANVRVDGQTFTADVEGRCDIRSGKSPATITVSYVGFFTQTFTLLELRRVIHVKLIRDREVLHGIHITGKQNRANGIISAAIRFKSRNDPQQVLRSFSFKGYNNLVITAPPDSISTKIDSLFAVRKGVNVFTGLDSSNYKFNKLVSRRHLFQAETVSSFQFANGRMKESITGTRMAGFSQPVYELIAFHLQSLSVYDYKYELFETKYQSPLSDGALNEYSFTLLDSVVKDGRKSYAVYFNPKLRRKKAGLHGLLYIDSRSYAVSKAIMRVRGVLDITAVHEFSYVPEHDLWFPAEREFKIVKGKNNEDIRILGETLRFDADDNDGKSRPKQASDYAYLLSRSVYSDAVFNEPTTIRQPSIAIQISDAAIRKDDQFWQQYRRDTTDHRSIATYMALDSLIRREKVEKKLRIGRKLLTGYMPLGPVDVDLRSLLSYNNYEGFRLGLGGVTNDRFSSHFRIDGYTAYGTKDGNFKYNLGGAVRIGRTSNTWIGAAYTDDIREIASSSFAIDRRTFKIYDPRPFNISTFYSYQKWRAYIETRIIPKTESIWQLTRSAVDPEFAYVFAPDNRIFETYVLSTAMASIQWNPFSEYMQTPTGRLEVEKRFPKFTFQITKSLPSVAGNDFEFAKFDFRTEYEQKYLNGQRTSVLIEAGLANGDIPLTHLYNTSPNNLTKDRLLQRITFSGKNSFETMYFNEFFSSEYLMFQIKHGFRRVTLFSKMKPSLVLVSRMAWGNMRHPDRHAGIDYKTLDNGYFESGVELNKIFKGLGISGFYRYGPNQLPRFEDNLALKVNFMLDLGF
jgi:hypothetical protein